MTDQIGQRVRSALGAVASMTQKKLASSVGMTEDALSRALNGKRGFSSIELVRIAEKLGADLHELITGELDPNRVSYVARGTYDHELGNHTVPTEDGDKEALENVRVAYVQAKLPKHTRPLPTSPDEMRAALGNGFARGFAARVEERLDVDVIVFPGLGTSYSAKIAGRLVVVLPARPDWFRMNFDLAHELAHLAGIDGEADASTFASKLLLPPDELHDLPWSQANTERVADFLWERGVSTKALWYALGRENITHALNSLLARSTREVLHAAWSWEQSSMHKIAARTREASERRFPLALREAHEKRALDGEIGYGFLAWMLGVAPDTFEQQDDSGAGIDELADALGLELA